MKQYFKTHLDLIFFIPYTIIFLGSYIRVEYVNSAMGTIVFNASIILAVGLFLLFAHLAREYLNLFFVIGNLCDVGILCSWIFAKTSFSQAAISFPLLAIMFLLYPFARRREKRYFNLFQMFGFLILNIIVFICTLFLLSSMMKTLIVAGGILIALMLFLLGKEEDIDQPA